MSPQLHSYNLTLCRLCLGVWLLASEAGIAERRFPAGHGSQRFSSTTIVQAFVISGCSRIPPGYLAGNVAVFPCRGFLHDKGAKRLFPLSRVSRSISHACCTSSEMSMGACSSAVAVGRVNGGSLTTHVFGGAGATLPHIPIAYSLYATLAGFVALILTGRC